MINVAFVRGAYLNNFEGQNYIFRHGIRLHAFSSLYPLHAEFPFPVTKLPSLTDVPFFRRAIRFTANRILGDGQILFGLEKYADFYDIFHTADPHYYYSYQCALLRQKNKIQRLLVTSWETIPFNNEQVPAKKKIKRFVLNQADAIVCYTNRAKESLMREGIAEERITVQALGIDLTKFKPFKKKKLHGKVFLFAGRLVPEKGVWDVYNAYKRIRFRGSRLFIVGDGPLKKSLQKALAADGLHNEVVIRSYQYKDMPDVYRMADVFVLPSKRTATWEEQYGMVLLEAMASGLPVVSYKTGSIPEVVGNAGELVNEGDIDDLSRKMLQFMDPQINRKVGTMGVKRVREMFDAKKTAQQLAVLYKKILNYHG